MNEQSENFEALRKLLALKRYEQPPPGYFNRLPGQIIVRIETTEPTFFEKISQAFVLRPAVAYALGLVFCGSFVGSLLYSLQLRTASETAQAVNPSERWNSANVINPVNFANYDGAGEPLRLHVANSGNFALASTNEEPLPQASIFSSMRLQSAPMNPAPVNFIVPNR